MGRPVAVGFSQQPLLMDQHTVTTKFWKFIPTFSCNHVATIGRGAVRARIGADIDRGDGPVVGVPRAPVAVPLWSRSRVVTRIGLLVVVV